MTRITRVKNRILRWGPATLCMGAIFYLSSQPTLPEVPGLANLYLGDKIEHGIAYSVLGASIWRALSRKNPGWWQVLATVIISAAYGFTDESHQLYVPGRTFDMLDLTADAVGSAIAAIALTTTYYRRKSNCQTNKIRK